MTGGSGNGKNVQAETGAKFVIDQIGRTLGFWSRVTGVYTGYKLSQVRLLHDQHTHTSPRDRIQVCCVKCGLHISSSPVAPFGPEATSLLRLVIGLMLPICQGVHVHHTCAC
jgi:hypothetical protein